MKTKLNKKTNSFTTKNNDLTTRSFIKNIGLFTLFVPTIVMPNWKIIKLRVMEMLS